MEEEKLIPVADYHASHPKAVSETVDGKEIIDGQKIIEQDGKKFIKEIVSGETVNGYKLYKNAVLL